MKVYIAFTHNCEKFVKSSDLILKVNENCLCDTCHISLLRYDPVCFIRVIADHTEVCKLRCIKTSETVNIDLILRKDTCYLLKTSWCVLHKNNILLYHNNLSSFL